MEKDLIDNYEKLINEEVYFDISKEDLNIIVEPSNISSKESYRHIQKLGGIQKLLERLEVNPQNGIEDDQDPRSTSSKTFFLRKKFFGKNGPFLPPSRSFISCLWQVIKNQFMLFLLFAATLNMVVNILYNNGKFFDYCSIYVVVIVISLITSFTSYSCERVFANYQLELDFREVRVIRNRTEKLIPKSELVVGDILIINSGDITPVDGIIIKSYTISISNRTREVIKYSNINYNKPHSSEEKLTEFPIILSGSKVLKGYAHLLVLTVGKDAYINKKIQRDHEIEVSQQRSESTSQETDSLTGSTSEQSLKISSGDKGGSHSETERKTRLTSKRRYSYNESLLYEDFAEVLREMSIKEKQIKDTEGVYSLATPLNKKLNILLLFHSKIGMFAGITTGLLFIITFFKGNHINDLGCVIFDAILYAIVLIIVAVPNGATLSSSLPLAFSINKMREEKALVKNPEAYEFMASVNCICTDYYGILTKDEMEIYSILIEDTTVEGRDLGNLKDILSEDMLSFFCENISINTIAFSAEKDGDLQYFGDSIECCLIKYLSKLGIDYRQLRNNPARPIIDSSPYTPENKISYAIISMEDKWEYKRLYVKGTPDTLLELISVYIEPGQVLEQFTQRHYEKVRSKCNSLLREGSFPLIICFRDIPNDIYNQARDLYSNNDYDFMINIVRQLTFICLIGLKDEIKPDVESYISNCKEAGVCVKMVTAKDKETAGMAAIKCGIIDPLPSATIDNEPAFFRENSIMRFINDDTSKIASSQKSSDKKDVQRLPSRSSITIATRSDVVDAVDEIRKFVEVKYLKDESSSSHSFELAVTDYNKFYKSLESALVICRAQAKDKFILVAALKKKGYCVAVTGEGVSDSIAMKAAHVGISMGYKSSDITKEAADVILMDDNFKSLIAAIVYGRNIYDSVRKFLQFQVTATIAVVFFAVLTSCPFFKYYFYPNQLLWINLIINALESIALASDEPDHETVLKKNPGEYSMSKKLINRQMLIRIIVQSSIQVLVLTMLLFFAPALFGVDDDTEIQYVNWTKGNGYHSTIIFNCIIFMLIFNAFISRNLDQNAKWIFSNMSKCKIFLLLQLLILFLQFPLINWGEFILRTKPLSIYQTFICLLISSVTLLTLPIVNWLPDWVLNNREEEDTNDIYPDEEAINMKDKTFGRFSRTNYITLKIVKKNEELNSYII